MKSCFNDAALVIVNHDWRHRGPAAVAKRAVVVGRKAEVKEL
jgi:hypothetical protein